MDDTKRNDTSNSKILKRSSSSIIKFSVEIMALEKMDDSERSVFIMSCRNACVLGPGKGLCGFHLCVG
jgi:hypothetical protein